jgi:uncharacterized protein
MKRLIEDQLTRWLHKPRRKPLIIRGARQVGKSTLVRNFAQAQNLTLADINLERHGKLDEIFQSNDPNVIIAELELLARTNLRQGNTLLFLDEIQSTPNAIAALRYFYEEMPQLPVVAAGSLLEFVLEKHDFSMPVGRVEYLHLGPMSFKEFLLATGEDMLFTYLDNFKLDQPLPLTAHQQLLRRQREYLFIGGMPESILAFCESNSMLEAREIHRSIIQTYQDDFGKYSRDATLNRVHKVFAAIPAIAGEKVKYTNISREDRSAEIKQAIELLIRARLLLPTYHSHCSGIPIKAGINERHYKLFFLDVGLLNYLYGLEWTQIAALDDRALLNEGTLAEQFIAQHLAYRFEGLEPPDLFYWLRENKSANAEVDFVTSVGKNIIPIEVKAGKSGSIKSLQQYALEKQSTLTCRFDLNPASLQSLSHQTRQKQEIATIDYQMLSLPLYMVEALQRLLLKITG